MSRNAVQCPYGSVALVTGASSGIGLATAQLLAEQGFTVYAASRSMPDCFNQLPLTEYQRRNIRPLQLDILDEQACGDVISHVLAEQKSLGIVVHCAGTCLAGAVEDTTLAETAWQMDNLFLGTVRVTRPVLTCMREQGSGLIVLISSVAATIPIPFHVYYSAGKAAVQAFALAMADEVRPFGVRVSVVAPGDTRTGFTAARQWSARNQPQAAFASRSPYQDLLERSVAKMVRDEQNGMSAVAIARSILRQVYSRNPDPVCIPGLSYQLLTSLANYLPARLVRKLVRLLYA